MSDLTKTVYQKIIHELNLKQGLFTPTQGGLCLQLTVKDREYFIDWMVAESSILTARIYQHVHIRRISLDIRSVHHGIEPKKLEAHMEAHRCAIVVRNLFSRWQPVINELD